MYSRSYAIGICTAAALVMSCGSATEREVGNGTAKAPKIGGSLEQFTLTHGVTVRIRVPNGWWASRRSHRGFEYVEFLRRGDQRSAEQLQTDAMEIHAGRPARAIHGAGVRVTTSCTPPAMDREVGQWHIPDVPTTSSPSEPAKSIGFLAELKLRSEICLVVSGGDIDTKFENIGANFARTLVETGAVSVDP